MDHKIKKASNTNLSSLKHRPTLGPLLAKEGDQQFITIKEEAWKHVTEKQPGTEVVAQDINRQYMSAGRSIVNEVKAFYDDAIMANMPEDDFVRMMVKDACFFLLLVLYWFGAELQFPPNHPIFGSNRDEKVLRMWMESMFIVGNQIPLILIEKMMSQSFFRQVIERTTQWRHPKGLMDKVLYEFVLVPAASSNNQCGVMLKTSLQGIVHQKPCDLLHGLYLMVLGQDQNGGVDEENEMQEVCYTMGLLAENELAEDVEESFHSAKKLTELGIKFEGVDDMGSRGIYLKEQNMIFKKHVLFLPCLVVDGSTELLLQCLKAYEMAQQFRKREVFYYSTFMSQLVPTIEDAKILERHGVIKGDTTKLPQLLKHVTASENLRLCRKRLNLRLQIDECTRSKTQTIRKALAYSFGVAMLVTQTVFAALQYFKE